MYTLDKDPAWTHTQPPLTKVRCHFENNEALINSSITQVGMLPDVAFPGGLQAVGMGADIPQLPLGLQHLVLLLQELHLKLEFQGFNPRGQRSELEKSLLTWQEGQVIPVWH